MRFSYKMKEKAILLFVFYFLHQTISFSQEEYGDDVFDITTTIMETAELPCKPKISNLNDAIEITPAPPNLVIWYKFGSFSPVYSFDRRKQIGGSSMADGSHWSNEEFLGHRGYYNARQYTLTVERVNEMDSGLYKCRLDFDRRPTENYIVNFTVVVPPKLVTISDTTGYNISGGNLNPIPEGRSLNLTCTAYGGKPNPMITWKLNEQIIDDRMEQDDEAIITITTTNGAGSQRTTPRNELFIKRLERNYQGAVLRCEASNDARKIISSELSIQLLLKPLTVQILGENRPFSASKEYKLTCVTYGSRPAANITWLVQGLRIPASAIESVNTEKNQTRSTFKFYPTAKDNKSKLTCKATNYFVHGSTIAHSWHLIVNYPPIPRVEMGRNLNPSTIREGVDVYFECIIDANPIAKKVHWTHNISATQSYFYLTYQGTILVSSTGIIISNQTLVLQMVSRRSAGNYCCLASNIEGESGSAPFYLDVKYEPICLANQQQVYGAIRFEEVQVSCHVDSNPPASKFRWQFNNSLIQIKDMQHLLNQNNNINKNQHNINNNNNNKRNISTNEINVITYQPKTELDYGTLLCWAQNEIDIQIVPCVFHIIPAGKPEIPRNCSILNVTENAFHVICESGFDGGLPQEFHCEILNNNTNRLLWNITNRGAAEFEVAGLEQDTTYKILIYASNAKGRSYGHVQIDIDTLVHLSQRHIRAADGSKSFYSTIWLPLLVLVFLILLCLLTAVIVTTLKMKRRGPRLKNRSDRLSNKNDLQMTELTTPLYSDDERNPDIIPHIEDTNARNVIRRSSKDNNNAASYQFAVIPQETNSGGCYVESSDHSVVLNTGDSNTVPPSQIYRNSMVKWTERAFPQYGQKINTVIIPSQWPNAELCIYHQQQQSPLMRMEEATAAIVCQQHRESEV